MTSGIIESRTVEAGGLHTSTFNTFTVFGFVFFSMLTGINSEAELQSLAASRRASRRASSAPALEAPMRVTV